MLILPRCLNPNNPKTEKLTNYIDRNSQVYSKRVEEVLTKTNTLAGGLASEDLESFAHLQDEEGGKLEEEEEIDAAAKEEVKAKKKVRQNLLSRQPTISKRIHSILLAYEDHFTNY